MKSRNVSFRLHRWFWQYLDMNRLRDCRELWCRQSNRCSLLQLSYIATRGWKKLGTVLPSNLYMKQHARLGIHWRNNIHHWPTLEKQVSTLLSSSLCWSSIFANLSKQHIDKSSLKLSWYQQLPQRHFGCQESISSASLMRFKATQLGQNQ